MAVIIEVHRVWTGVYPYHTDIFSVKLVELGFRIDACHHMIEPVGDFSSQLEFEIVFERVALTVSVDVSMPESSTEGAPPKLSASYP